MIIRYVAVAYIHRKTPEYLSRFRITPYLLFLWLKSAPLIFLDV